MEEGYAELVDWELILSTKSISMNSVLVEFSSEYLREKCPVVEDQMEEIWKYTTDKNNRIYNATKFRLHEATRVNGFVELKIGLTDYKDTVCTHFQDYTEKIFEYGKAHFSNKHACFADPVGVTAIVLTKDEHIVKIKRANWVGEGKGKMDTPGGHAEPGELLKKLNIDVEEVYKVDPKHVVHEIFHSMIREVRDEINAPESSLTWPTLLGLIRSRKTGCKPCFIFLVRCSLDSEEIKRLYAKGGAETDESTEISFLKVKEFKSLSKDYFLKLKDTWSPCGQSALMLYHQFLHEDQEMKEL